MTSYPPPGQYPPPPEGEPMYPAPAAGGYPPPPQFVAPGGHPADPPRLTPPPPPGLPATPIAAPPIAWLIPLAALLAVIGAFTPWFRPVGTFRGTSHDFDSLYSWKDGRIGLIPPIVLIVLAISVVGLLRGGKARGRMARAADPVRAAAKFAIGAGIGSAVCMLIAWFLLTSQYKFSVDGQTYSWSKVENLGISLSRGPQIGFFLTGAAAVVAIVGGVLMLLRSTPVTAAVAAPGGYPSAYPPAYPQQAAYPPAYPQQPAYPPAYPQQQSPFPQPQQPPTSLEKPPPAG